ncbi:MAG: ferrochelatase [Deinococcales bacterium]
MSQGPTAIVMMNLGGPKDLSEVEPFLLRLFADKEIIQLPIQNWLGPFIAKRRTPKIQKHYEEIGGGSPILKWTEIQGQGMCALLDKMSPETAPHKFYVAFRYIDPLSEDALSAMQRDGIKRAIAFTQYPQFSCATTGSSLNELWRASRRLGLEKAFSWSVIDRWPTHPKFIEAMTASVKAGLAQFDEANREDVLIVFSAHSLPMSIINRGDAYPAEIGASVHEVMKKLDYGYEYLISYQSEVGPVPWLGPSTEDVLKELGTKKRKRVLVVGIAFTSDHIETLHELDIEYGELAHEVGISEFKRAPAFNDDKAFQEALAHIVYDHLQAGEVCHKLYGMRCPGCINPQCRNILNPIGNYKRMAVTPSAKAKDFPQV